MRTNNWLKNVFAFTIGWFLSSCLWSAIRRANTEIPLLELQEQPSLVDSLLIIAGISISCGIVFGSIQYYSEYVLKRKRSFKQLITIALIFHVVIMLLLYLGIYIFLFQSINNEKLLFKDFLLKPVIIVNLIYTLLINSAIVLIIYINKLFGKGNLLKLVTGKFYKPKEEFRAFVFLDLKSSTQLAEVLGHLTYSKFIQDCFYDLSIIEKTQVEIYQYVGDEAVLTFQLNDSFGVDSCLAAFFLFSDRLAERKSYYLEHYGVAPIFKAGMHLGQVTATEVGNFKREIAYHGDAINIAARIQGQCNVFDKPYLISENVIQRIKNKELYSFNRLDEIILKGKTQPTTLFSVERNTS